MSPHGLLIDPNAFTREGGALEAKLPLAAFERIASAVMEPVGEIALSAQGSIDSAGKRWLDLAASGSLRLQCQRCLEIMAWPFEISSRLLLVPEGQPLPDDDLEEDDWDPVPFGRQMDLVAVVEDEVLLALPIAPRHEVCSAPSAADRSDGVSPFAGLGALRDAGKT